MDLGEDDKRRLAMLPVSHLLPSQLTAFQPAQMTWGTVQGQQSSFDGDFQEFIERAKT